MKKRFLNKKVAAIGLAIGLAAGLGGAAFAYFTSTGAGNGTASVGTTGSNIAVEGTSTPALTPGNSATMTFTAYNYSDFHQAISNIHVTGVSACSTAFAAPNLTSFATATAAPSCADTGTQLAADTACATGGVANATTTNWFTLPDVPVSPTGDGNLASATGATPSSTVLTEKGTVTMNDQDVNQNACQGLFLNFTFSTT